jgi:hypothetical protein
LSSCWGTSQEKGETFSAEDVEKWLSDIPEQISHLPSMDELLSQMAEDQEHVAILQRWLDEQVQ